MSMSFDEAMKSAEKALRRLKFKHNSLKKSYQLLVEKTTRHKAVIRKLNGIDQL